MESSGECMINDTTLVTLGGSSASGVTFLSKRVLGGRGHELKMKRQVKPENSVVNTSLVLVPTV